MKLRTNIFYVAVFMVAALSSCSSTEGLSSHYPYLSQLSNSKCLNSRALDDEESNDTDAYFEMKITGNTAECLIKSLKLTCGFGLVNVDVSFNDGIMTIVVYPASGVMMDCLCEVDTNFKIEELPEGNFILKLYNGYGEGEYNKDYPMITEVIKVENGTVTFPLYSE